MYVHVYIYVYIYIYIYIYMYIHTPRLITRLAEAVHRCAADLSPHHLSAILWSGIGGVGGWV